MIIGFLFLRIYYDGSGQYYHYRYCYYYYDCYCYFGVRKMYIGTEDVEHYCFFINYFQFLILIRTNCDNNY